MEKKNENSYWGRVGTLWGGDGGKKVPLRTRRGGDGGWGRDNGAGAGDRILAPLPSLIVNSIGGLGVGVCFMIFIYNVGAFPSTMLEHSHPTG